MRFFRPTLRARMALLYGALILVVGIALLFTCILLVNQAIADLIRGQQPQASGTTGGSSSNAIDLASAQGHATSFLLHTGLIYFAVVLIVGTVAGYLVAKRALRPIVELTQTAQALSTDNLDQRIDFAGPDDELHELADTFDAMLGRLSAAFESQRLFVANASHELRTPLSVIRTELEVTLSDPDADRDELRRMAGVVASAAERAQRLVTSLLTLARLQAVGGGELEVRESVDLAQLVPTALLAVTTEADDKRVRIETEGEAALTVGDPRLLERMIGNLVENAIRHNVPGGWLRVTTGQSGDQAWVHVANGGSVIPGGDVTPLFEPFRRGGRMRTATRGAGLGLSIVRLIVEAHHGVLQAAAPPFGGLTVRIELPRQQRELDRPRGLRITAGSTSGSGA